MPYSTDLIATARDLLVTVRGRPRQTNLRRAVSTTYYALFHCLAECCANTLVGGMGADRDPEAWRQAYRGLNHHYAKAQCRKALERNPPRAFPRDVLQFAERFVFMQDRRHAADYDPFARFSKSDVVQSIDSAEDAIMRFAKAPANDRRAFAVYALLPLRTG